MYKSITYSTFFILFLGLVAIGCSKDDMTADPQPGTYEGSFVSGAHPTSGTASVNEGGDTLTLSNFKTDPGPDLNIWLVSDINNITGDYIDLGDIKGVEGNYTYDIEGIVDFETYKYVVVWCVAFDVNFGHAVLVKQ